MAAKYWEGKAAFYEFSYDGGEHSPVAGETINVDGEEGDETAVIQAWSVTGGAWATNDATGKMWVYSCSATFIANLADNDVIEDSGGTTICDTTGGVTDKTGDWQCAGNWGTGEDPAVPIDANEVIFDGRSTQVPDEGMLASESGANGSGSHPVMHFRSTWAQGVASAAEPLVTHPERLIIDGSGTYYISCGKDDQDTDATIDWTYISNASATVYLYSNCNDATPNTCEFTDVYVAAGTVYLAFLDSSVVTDAAEDAGCWVPTLYMSPTNNQLSKVTVHIQKDAVKVNGTVEMSIKMRNGTLNCDSALDTLDMADGTVYYGTDLGASPETGLDITRLNQWAGTFYWQPDDSGDDAYIKEAWLFGGKFDASGTTNNDRAKVLGTGANYDVHVFPGAIFDIANGKGNITVAGGATIRNMGGTITVDRNASIAITYDS